jgi:hypothetical protein
MTPFAAMFHVQSDMPAHDSCDFTKVKLCQQQKAGKLLTCENTVPEVGLELHSSPRKHWEPVETCGIRISSKTVRADP